MPVPQFSPMAGTIVAANFEFVDDVGEPANPTEATFTVRSPDGTLTAYAPVNLGVGLYRVEFPVNVGGIWVAQARGTGALTAVDETEFEVRFPTVPLDA